MMESEINLKGLREAHTHKLPGPALGRSSQWGSMHSITTVTSSLGASAQLEDQLEAAHWQGWRSKWTVAVPSQRLKARCCLLLVGNIIILSWELLPVARTLKFL
jgi:hypothetical protein